jgi:hypothetical protein
MLSNKYGNETEMAPYVLRALDMLDNVQSNRCEFLYNAPRDLALLRDPFEIEVCEGRCARSVGRVA